MEEKREEGKRDAWWSGRELKEEGSERDGGREKEEKRKERGALLSFLIIQFKSLPKLEHQCLRNAYACARTSWNSSGLELN